VRVFVIWEPILTGDWRRPTTRTLARIPDSRAAQFWDPDHLIAEELHRAVESNAHLPNPSCCVNHGHFWDMVAIFPPEARANGTLPPPIFFEGTVVGQESTIRSGLKELLSAHSARGQLQK
jgi:hypothetical protein